LTDSELLQRIKKASEFSGIFKLYSKPIFGYILRRTGNFDETADIAANSFFKTFMHVVYAFYSFIDIDSRSRSASDTLINFFFILIIINTVYSLIAFLTSRTNKQ
jgi:hypothetical protein